MNIRQMLDVTTLISAHSSNLIELGLEIPQDALHRYWSCSRGRLRIWLSRLEAYPQEVTNATDNQRAAVSQRTMLLLNELFATELVTRVWGAILTACDRRRTHCDAELIARNVLMGHMEARQKGLRIMVNGPHVTLEQIAEVDSLRRRVERWTDLLLGHLVKQHGMGDFAFDVERSLDFGTTQLEEPCGPRRNQVWQLYRICLGGAFPEVNPPNRLHERFRIEIVRTMLACFPAEIFHESGPLKSNWLRQIAAETMEGPPRAGICTALRPAPHAPQANAADNSAATYSKLRRTSEEV